MHPKQNERAIRKMKALMSKRKHEQSFCYAPNRESGCILSMRFFSGNTSREWRRRKHAGIIHIPGGICRFALGFCKNIKKRTETLYQSFSPFMAKDSYFDTNATPVPVLYPATGCISRRGLHHPGGGCIVVPYLHCRLLATPLLQNMKNILKLVQG